MSARRRIVAHLAGLVGLSLLLAAPGPVGAQATGDVRQQARETTAIDVAAQLGVKLSPNQPEEFGVGSNLSGLLADTAHIARLGLRGVRAGARITITRVGPQRVRVESDELDPTPRSRVLMLRIDGAGRLAPVEP